ncbi:hypothetical protein P154DRAFT_573343 [Amniculicola lignicola CBS 123094]|uniref:Cell cycle control protein cwf19 n=1 Tax=Amniculicola lignicola CBS 123094 TaxID=1392246 RepID=A0A6A5WRE8_9PLEO|nr:hypothetical protein P154DRAFT_573343 [Amniculicola lignicola CBS 123094]
MGLEDFEKELAQSKAKEPRKKRDRSRSRDREHRHHRSSKDKDHEHRSRHHHSSHHDHKDDDREGRHRSKRSRHHRETSGERARRKRREKERDGDGDPPRRKHKERRSSAASSDDEDFMTRKRKPKHFEEDESSDDARDDDRDMPPADEDELDQQLEEAAGAKDARDSWMEAPSAMAVDYVNRTRKKEDKSQFVVGSGADTKQWQAKNPAGEKVEELPVEREIDYEFGDRGAQWRMTKLKGVYKTAKESGKSVEEVALDKYGDLRDFDDAREEETELDRREMYGKGYVGKIKPSGELFEERRLKADIHHPARVEEEEGFDLPQGEIVTDAQPTGATMTIDRTALNKLKADLMKAKIKKAANVKQLEESYNAAAAAFANRKEGDVVVLNAMDNRMLAGGRKGEVIAIENKRGKERGTVVENNDMSIEDMVRQERRTKNQAGGEGMLLAEKIAKDSKFDNDLEYMDENAEKLATRAPKSAMNLRNMAIADYQKMNRVLDNCPLCHHEEKSPPLPPVAPVVSLATRVFLTLPTEPEIGDGGAVIVPIQHHTNLLECDDDEWDEIRNFMKCLTRMYHDQGRDVIFYENAASPQRKLHAALNAVPIPYDLGETASAFFREAILDADEEWTQHKKIIDTLKASKSGLGKQAFRKSLAKEMPYFHVWFELDGGMGHIVEDERRWPKGDLFAREVLGGMLDTDMEVVKRQGRWTKGDRRVDGWRKGWRKFDWTRVLMEGQ